jgi:hypothetical protein
VRAVTLVLQALLWDNLGDPATRLSALERRQRVVSTAGGAYHARSWCSDQNVWSEVRPASEQEVCRPVRVLEGYCEK